MSAYIVNDNTINAVLGFADEYTLRKFECQTRDQLGQILLNENYRSVNYRYGEDAQPPVFAYRRYTVPAVAAAQHLQCFEYQACETPDWERTTAFRLCADLRSKICERLVSESGAIRVWDAPGDVDMVESMA